MSVLQASSKVNHLSIARDNFLPPNFESFQDPSQLEEALAEVTQVIAPVWPLQDYVAVNPYAGISHRSFLDARAYLKAFSDCETLMPIEHYAAEYHHGRLTQEDIQSAINELAATGVSPPLTANQIAQNLMSIGLVDTSRDLSASTPNDDRPIRTIAETINKWMGQDIDWHEAIVAEISKHCAAHYDQSQAVWASPYKHLSLYEAWRKVAEHDCNIEILGLTDFRKFVACLPHTPEACIAYALKELSVPQPLWSTFLLCQAFSIPGWSAWAKYQTSWAENSRPEKNDLVCLLAIRLAYDVALAEAKSVSVNWSSYVDMAASSFKLPQEALGSDSKIRFILLRASEIAHRNSLLKAMSFSEGRSSRTEDRKLAQLVFCIDVRSERIRRQLEAQSQDIETFGFAGFFGMAFEYATLGQPSGNLQLPVLLKPQFKVHECVHEADAAHECAAINKREQARTWRALWKSFQASAVGCFSFVETTGLLVGLKLLTRVAGYNPKRSDAKYDGLGRADHSRLGPTLRGLNHQGITTSRQADLAEGMLRNLGLTKNFARIVVFCGHACQTDNNPLAAGLDCGACGGHSGEPNARFAAMLLNQPYIRQAMADRGIDIPADTHFVGALHNTTTDRIEFFDTQMVPTSQQDALQQLKTSCAIATRQTQLERMPIVSSSSPNALLRRATDWSEVRPEWGLAGNASFIVAPRSMTQKANLEARSFLHSYDYTQDTQGRVLETIMTAPMIVANWINMQYYASTVDNCHFGSGTKTVHNVVGGFGILSGNGGDLMTGLPWQSLHTGKQFQHLPMRLQVVINAPREMIDRIIAKHQLVADLLTGGWLHLVAIEEQTTYRYTLAGKWESLHLAPSPSHEGVSV
ncbi:MAG: DUF2309 domain-containing protein [Pirellulaceae bacterium]|nr:DUF2309 domain-containing protein [Pirellulaceae bacterium]